MVLKNYLFNLKNYLFNLQKYFNRASVFIMPKGETVDCFDGQKNPDLIPKISKWKAKKDKIIN